MSKVVLVRCESYDYKEVLAAVKRGMDLLGGALKFVKKGEKILLKPNFLAAETPEKCVTTHPAVFKAVGEVFQAAGADLSYGDSPLSDPRNRGEGFRRWRRRGRIENTLSRFQNGRNVVFEKAIQNKKLFIANGALDCDGVISLPKLKTHGFQKMTCCIKNQFGYVPALRKGEFHVKTPSSVDFAKMLVDLNMFIRPRLYILDGIKAMRG